MIDDALHQLALQRTSSAIAQATDYFNLSFSLPDIRYNLRGKAAGKAYLTRWEIRLNPVLFAENQQTFIEEVIPHEIAHLIAYQCYGRVKPHGLEWQQIMRQVFGLVPQTTHNLNTQSVMGTCFEYQCACQTHMLSIRRHNKVQNHQASYLCKRCRSPLTFTGHQTQ